MPDPDSSRDEWVQALLLLSSRGEQEAALRSAGWLNEQGLSALLALAMPLARSDPRKASHLTALCADLADLADAPALLPRALYLRAQTHAINGEFATALELIEAARARYQAIGDTMEALRTNVGLMHVLNELGRHQQALDAGEAVLHSLAAPNPPSGDLAQLRLLAALVHQNRGICFEKTGRYEMALMAYASAEAAFAALGMQERAGDILNNRGIALMHMGRASEALSAFQRAVDILGKAGWTLLQAQALSNIGEANLVLGHYTRSLGAFEEARRLLDTLGALAHQHILLRKVADAYLILNLYPEALAAYREAVEVLAHAGMSNHLARALWGLGSTLIAQSQLGEAEGALSRAAALFAAAGNTPLLCSVMLEQAALQDARGERPLAVQTALQALDQISDERWPVEWMYATMRVADLLLPDLAAAEAHLTEARHLADFLHLPQIGYRLDLRLGEIRMLEGRTDEAQQLLEGAIAQIEQLRGTLTHEALRVSFLQDKTAAYERLLELYLEKEGEAWAESAFAVAEQAKSRALVDLLVGVVDNRPATGGDPQGTARLWALQSELNAVYDRLLGDDREADDPQQLPDLHERAALLEGEIRSLQLKAAMAHGPARDALSAALSPDQGSRPALPSMPLVAYHIIGDEIMAFVRQGTQLVAVRRLSTPSIVQGLLQRLTVQWNRFRVGASFAQRHIATLELSARRLLAALYDELLAPLVPLLGPAPSADTGSPLVIVPHGVLHQVPFHALHDGSAYLIDRWELSYAPSATVFALCQQRARRRAGGALVIGVPDPLIPAVAEESRAVTEQLALASPAPLQKVAEQATLAAVRAAAQGRDILHLACHGLFRADNPMFSALKLHDGWLTAAEIMQWELTDSLVTLSACESGRGQVLLGDEVIGLPRAFLGAGVATLVVSLWLVQDESTAELMTDWYTRLGQQVSPATALRAAQLALKERFPHPYYWAPFVLIGKR